MNSTNGTPRLVLTVAEAAEQLRIGRTTAYRLCANGDLPTIRVGNSIRIPVRPLIDKLQRSANP
jgi:excisionase family DNA binding protein